MPNDYSLSAPLARSLSPSCPRRFAALYSILKLEEHAGTSGTETGAGASASSGAPSLAPARATRASLPIPVVGAVTGGSTAGAGGDGGYLVGRYSAPPLGVDQAASAAIAGDVMSGASMKLADMSFYGSKT